MFLKTVAPISKCDRIRFDFVVGRPSQFSTNLTDMVGNIPSADTSDEALAKLTSILAETAEQYDRSAEFPWEAIQAVHDAGILRLGIGPAHGGRDLSATEAARVMQALGKGDPSVALLAAMTIMQHVAQATSPRWPDELYRTVVRDSLDHPVLLNAIRAEPELGAPARGGLPATTIRRTADGWVLNGHKSYGTGAEGLAYHLVWAVTEDEDPLIGHVIVPADSPGIRCLGYVGSAGVGAIFGGVWGVAGVFLLGLVV